MKRFQNILVVTEGMDGGVAAVKRAADLADQNSAKITLVDVVDPLPPLLEFPGILQDEMHRSLVEDTFTKLERLAKPLRETGIEVDCKVLQGTPAEQIVGQVVAGGHDLLIKTADESPGAYGRLFGTTCRRLMRKCPCPVWIIKAGSEQRFHRVLAAVDPRPPDQERDPLNIKILELATSLAEANDSELHVVYVWPYWARWLSPQPDGLHEGDVDKMEHEVETLQDKMLSVLIAPFRNAGQIDHVHLLKGKPGDEIAKLTEELSIELLVMGTICRTGIIGFLIGNTAERALDQVKCSVLTIKPDTFVPPVETQCQGD
jgi:nucleotide-binding universal stress UspA family protein